MRYVLALALLGVGLAGCSGGGGSDETPKFDDKVEVKQLPAGTPPREEVARARKQADEGEGR